MDILSWPFVCPELSYVCKAYLFWIVSYWWESKSNIFKCTTNTVLHAPWSLPFLMLGIEYLQKWLIGMQTLSIKMGKILTSCNGKQCVTNVLIVRPYSSAKALFLVTKGKNSNDESKAQLCKQGWIVKMKHSIYRYYARGMICTVSLPKFGW